MRSPVSGLIFLCRSTSSSTGRSVVRSTRRVPSGSRRALLLEGEAAVAVHRVGHVDEQGVGHGIPAVGHEGVDDLLGVVAGGAGVPQAERGDAVGVHVLGGALELGERGDGAARGLGVRVVDLEEEGLVALDDQGSVIHRVGTTPIWFDVFRGHR